MYGLYKVLKLYRKAYEKYGEKAVQFAKSLPMASDLEDWDFGELQFIEEKLKPYFNQCKLSEDYRYKNWMSDELGVSKLILKDKGIYEIGRLYNDYCNWQTSHNTKESVELFNEFTLFFNQYSIVWDTVSLGEGFCGLESVKNGVCDGFIFLFHGNFYGDSYFEFIFNLFSFKCLIQEKLPYFQSKVTQLMENWEEKGRVIYCDQLGSDTYLQVS